MNQQLLIQSGCQQWIRQPAAIGPSQFAVSSSLAIYVHGSEDYRLIRILAQHNQHLNAVCWSPVDTKLLACATSEQVVKVYNVESEGVVYSAQLPVSHAIKKLCWATHDENVLMAVAGSTVGCWAYKTGEWRLLHNFKAAVTCMQQSASETRLLAVGCADCTLHLYDLLLNKVVCTVRQEEGVVPCDVQFDPLSKQYLLLLCRNGSITLYGISEEQHALAQVFVLSKQPAAERSAAFVPNQPGNFVSISNKTGVLQLWNVSQHQPLKNMKTGKGPAQSVQFFLGSSKTLLTFQDGTVMVYDVRTEEVLWCTQPGHTETIFDCQLHPTNPQLLATCSYDGSVRVWDVASGSCISTLDLLGSTGGQSQPTALYSVAWCYDGSHLAASGVDGAVYLFDYAKGIAVKKWQLHTKMSLKVAWHPTDTTLLVSSSIDGTAIAFKMDGTKVKVLRHATSTSGLAWHPTATRQLATTSEAGPVYIWDLNKPGESCLMQTLNGHSRRSFSVAWSPLLPDLLLSGSDDATARVWDVKAATCVALLLGHASEVRALCWHPEIPWLVFTGSWDSTIRAWDIRQRACLYVSHHHHGDVYGLSIHKARPWVMVSASRDTTLRLWDLKGLAAGLLPRCFLDGTLPQGQAEQYMTHDQPLLCGTFSQQLAEWYSRHIKSMSSSSSSGGSSNSSGSCSLSSLSVAARVEAFQKLSAYFSAPGAAQTLWQLAAAVAAHMCSSNAMQGGGSVGPGDAAGSPTSVAALQRAGSMGLMRSGSSAGSVRPLPAKESCGFQHFTAAKAALVSAANQLELGVRARGIGKAAMGAAKKEEVLQEAALLHLQAGHVKHCCDLLVDAGEWDKALMLAPAVSHYYWAKLLKKRADTAVQAGADVRELLPLMLAAGQSELLTELLLARKQYGLASGIAAVQACGGYQHFSSTPAADPTALASASPALASPLCPSAAAAGHAAPGPLSPLSNLPQVPQLLPPHKASLLGMRRNSLPPLRAVAPVSNSANISSSSPGSPPMGAAGVHSAGLQHSVSCGPAGSAAAAGLDRSGSLGRPASPCSPLAGAPGSPAAESAGPGCGGVLGGSSTLEWSPQVSGSFDRMRSCSRANCAAGACLAVPDGAAMGQLAAVRQAQARACRRQGQPLMAACAALTVNDVAGAITALHLGHEPEQAAMLALAFGELAGVDSSLLDRVYAALAVRCEAAGDWDAAAAAIKLLSMDVQHHLELLVVRSERGSRHRMPEADKSLARSLEADNKAGAGGAVVSGLRQRLVLIDAAQYASAAGITSDPLVGVRMLLLAGEHVRAAAKASIQLHALGEHLQQQAILASAAPEAGTSRDRSAESLLQCQQQPVAIEGVPAVQQLFLWQACLDSLDPAALPPTCWQEMFAFNLLAGALRAFVYGYFKVGSFLMSCLRRWLEQHQVKFPLCRAAILVLEADAISTSSPESACSLLVAAADGLGTPASITAAARQRLLSYPKAAATPNTSSTDAESTCVVPTGSCLPCRGPAVNCRSAVSGKPLEGPWVLLDDGVSAISLAEGVMLAHVMHCGPYGSGQVLQLL